MENKEWWAEEVNKLPVRGEAVFEDGTNDSALSIREIMKTLSKKLTSQK